MKNFVITISRGYGSGGKTIGERLAKDLNVQCYDWEILQLASEKSGINEQLFTKSDENIKNMPFLKAITQKGAFKKGEVIPPTSKDFVSDENLFNYQAQVMRELASKESCIFVGRAADFVLADMDNVLRVNIQSPFDSCVKTVMDMFSISKDEAEKRIKKIDKERSAYYKYYTGNEWNDVLNYDISLNSDIGWDKCVELIKYALNQKLA